MLTTLQQTAGLTEYNKSAPLGDADIMDHTADGNTIANLAVVNSDTLRLMVIYIQKHDNCQLSIKNAQCTMHKGLTGFGTYF